MQLTEGTSLTFAITVVAAVAVVVAAANAKIMTGLDVAMVPS